MSITLYNQYIYKNGNWYLVGVSDDSGGGVTYELSGSGATITLTGSDSSTSTATVSGFLTTESDPTVPSWAKASSKPSYTASEVGAIANPSSKSSGQFLKYNGSAWVADSAPVTSVNSKTGAVSLSASDVGALPDSTTIPQGTVTSVRVQATSPVQSSTNTAQSTSLNTTISLADGYGDTKNPYAAKNANKVLAGPSSGSDAAPSFRALVASDIPSLTVSKISDFPSTMTPSSHTHGSITNDGKISSDTTVASGDKIVITDSSASSAIKRSGIAFGTDTTTFLRNDGSWQTPAYPVTSVNTKTGAVSLTASDVGALPSTTTYVSSFNGSTGAVTYNPIPSQTGNSGKFLTTNGSAVSWATITIPSVEAMSTSDIDTAIASA